MLTYITITTKLNIMLYSKMLTAARNKKERNIQTTTIRVTKPA